MQSSVQGILKDNLNTCQITTKFMRPACSLCSGLCEITK